MIHNVIDFVRNHWLAIALIGGSGYAVYEVIKNRKKLFYNNP